MHITLAMVLSVDGKSTKGDLEDQSWASSEDQSHLQKLISENNLILMGGKTYASAKTHIKPSEGKLRMVLTHDLEQFKNNIIPGQLEFSNLGVEELIKNLEDRGFSKMLLLSGENLNKDFFEKNLVDEVYFTLEPKIFGSGRSVAVGDLDIDLQLMEMEKLNQLGTILLRYKVVRTRS
jgi:riboflavin biosynthesis pyrimidine reductase